MLDPKGIVLWQKMVQRKARNASDGVTSLT